MGKLGTPAGIWLAAFSSMVDILGAPAGNLASIAAGYLVASVKSALMFV
jgi:hypothetical protein